MLAEVTLPEEIFRVSTEAMILNESQLIEHLRIQASSRYLGRVLRNVGDVISVVGIGQRSEMILAPTEAGASCHADVLLLVFAVRPGELLIGRVVGVSRRLVRVEVLPLGKSSSTAAGDDHHHYESSSVVVNVPSNMLPPGLAYNEGTGVFEKLHQGSAYRLEVGNLVRLRVVSVEYDNDDRGKQKNVIMRVTCHMADGILGPTEWYSPAPTHTRAFRKSELMATTAITTTTTTKTTHLNSEKSRGGDRKRRTHRERDLNDNKRKK